jgi:hypothetical protein
MDFDFTTINLGNLSRVHHPGTAGSSYWQTVEFTGLRIRVVEYSKGFILDHWCEKGHVLYCCDGQLEVKLQDGTSHSLTRGMAFIVSDEMSSHTIISEGGAKVFVIDGKFLERTRQ